MNLEHTREWVRAVVRSGLLAPEQLPLEVASVLAADHPGEDAGEWIAREYDAWRADAAGWPDVTEHDRIQSAFDGLSEAGILVIQAVPDHWAVTERLASSGRAIAWFTQSDVWHAVDEAMLEVNLWHASGANAAPDDELLADALACFAAAGLPAVFDEGRIEVGARWERRPPSA